MHALRPSLHYALILPEGRGRGQNFAAPYRPWLACPPCPLRVHGPLRHPGARPAPPTSSRPPLGGFGRAVAPYGRAFLSATARRWRQHEWGREPSLRPDAATRRSVSVQLPRAARAPIRIAAIASRSASLYAMPTFPSARREAVVSLGIGRSEARPTCARSLETAWHKGTRKPWRSVTAFWAQTEHVIRYADLVLNTRAKIIGASFHFVRIP